ncbi:MAG: hypothetical protein ACPGXK_17460, partial [Phycisphaerae bacterium]
SRFRCRIVRILSHSLNISPSPDIPAKWIEVPKKKPVESVSGLLNIRHQSLFWPETQEHHS